MTDPLAEMVQLLQPGAPFSKVVSAAGRWRVHRPEPDKTFYGVNLEGRCRLDAEGQAPIVLEPGDFILIPSTQGFSMSSLESAPEDTDSVPVALGHGEFRLGEPDGPPDVRYLVGYCVFGAPDASLLVPLLPRLIHVRGEPRLTTLVQLVTDECRAQRPARDVILARLLEVLFVEALRSTAGTSASSGLLRGLADERLAVALRRLHEAPTRAWTVEQLADEAALSRTAFFQRFQRVMGMAPMAYLLTWRMALAKHLLRQGQASVAEIAERVGYRSVNTFGVAFTRHVGMPPRRYATQALRDTASEDVGLLTPRLLPSMAAA
ncbi:AraC family transcriptional regulator [Achromobacter sp. GG226]|uniref:AraC family transcriptional regulator n=1 Tax=Verticiella alkaliphila TaxID=2779529 RepID=UPI001C0D6B7A|nr:AraC family transcriptional regulator [Verticiella sp. GG226]MBU4611748.1 AraC family transcriptional regulator [Verticiella sp. GG226]